MHIFRNFINEHKQIDMGKNLFLAVVMACSVAATMRAQTVYDFKDYVFYAPIYEEEATPIGVFYNVSPSGQYAVGCDDGVMNCMESYLWSKDAPDTLLIINATANRMSAIDVSDNGTVVGSHEDRGDDLDTKTVTYPAYRTIDGTWKTLPVPDEYSEYQATYTSSFAEEARAITPDDKYIAGNVHLIVGYNETFGYDIVYPTPLLWELTDTGYVLKKTFLGLGDAGKSYLYKDGELVLQENAMNYKSFLVYDISRDGSMICGMNTAGSGGQNPSIIRDSVLIQLFDCGTYGETNYDSLNFQGGICNSIDANGNVYGYYVEFDSSIKYFVYTNEDEIVYYDEWYICGAADGTKVLQSNEYISYVLDCSDDGKVIAGGGLTTSAGANVNYPIVMVYDEAEDSTANDTTETAIDRVEAIKNNVGVSYSRGGMLYVNGQYKEAQVFNASGMSVASGRQGTAFNMSGYPSGAYIVRVRTDDGVKTYKIMR